MSESLISGETTMGELQRLIPGARRALFAAYHIGGCQSCGFQDDETLAQVCERNENLPVDTVVAHLEAAAEHDRALQIEPSALKAKLDAGAEIKLLDIRSREEFDAVKIEGSAILTTETQQEAFGKWDPATEVVIIDHSGDRSLDAASFFVGHGLKQTKALAGGIDAYAQVADPPLPRYKIELEAS